ncbi:MAG: hypothetical protein ACK55I_12510 [bacterium]
MRLAHLHDRRWAMRIGQPRVGMKRNRGNGASPALLSTVALAPEGHRFGLARVLRAECRGGHAMALVPQPLRRSHHAQA